MDNIGPYKLLRQVGRGGLGVVYRAVDTRSGQNIALKVLYRANSDELAAHRLRREFRALYSIRHPNIVRVLDAGFHDGLPFLAMELVDGLPLRSYLALPDTCDTGPQPPRAGALRVPASIASGESREPGAGGSGSGGSGSKGTGSKGTGSEGSGSGGSGSKGSGSGGSGSKGSGSKGAGSEGSGSGGSGSKGSGSGGSGSEGAGSKGSGSRGSGSGGSGLKGSGDRDGGSGAGDFGSNSRGSAGSTSFEAPEEAESARKSGVSHHSADSNPTGQPRGRWAEEWVELGSDEDTETSGSSLSWMFDDEPDSLPTHRRVRPGVQALASKASSPGLLPPEVTQELNRPQRLLRLKGTLVQLCSGLDFIHRRGLVHRDIKPANILVEEGGRAKLVDFGLVKLAEGGNTTAAGHVVGTYRYMSPEQARGQRVDSRSDLYALGSVLYDMLCGQPPFPQTQTFELMDAIANRLPPDPRELNPGADPLLCAVAMRLLEKKPESRFQQASEVAALLN